MPEEPKEWITVNGKHIPLDENGEPMNETGKKTLGKETGQGAEAKNNEGNNRRLSHIKYTKRYGQYLEESGGDHKKAATAFFKEQLQGKSLLCNVDGQEQEVHFTGGSWKELKRRMEQEPLKAEIVPHIQEILKDGKCTRREIYKERKDGAIAFYEFYKNIRTSQGRKEVLVDVVERERTQFPYSVYSATGEGISGYEKRRKHEGNEISPTGGRGRNHGRVGESNDSVVSQIIHDVAQNEKEKSYLEVVNIRFADEENPKEARDMPRDRPRADRLAFDFKSTKRRKDSNGYLHVEESNITKEQVAPYYGDEIPDWQSLGLEPRKLYYMYRPAEELERAVDTFNGMPLLFEHHQTNADNPAKEYVIGSLGTDAEFRAPYVVNSLIITDGEAIDAIERGDYRELSAAYVYKPVMTGGIFGGEHYDGRMTEIKANHVALVKEGRAGSDVAVADAKPKLRIKMANTTKRRTCDTMRRKAVRRKGTLTFDAVPAIEGMEVNLAAMMKAVQVVEAQREGLDPRSINLDIDAGASIEEIVEKFFPNVDDDAKVGIAVMLEELKSAPATDEGAEDKPEAQDDDDEDNKEFAEGVKYGEELERDPSERRKLDREHESEGMRRAMEDCNIDADDPDSSRAFAEGVKYGEKLMRNKAEREKLDREHESEGMKKLLKDQKEELEEQKAAMDSKLRKMKEKTMADMKAHYKALYAAAQDCRPILGNLVDPMTFDSADDIYRKALTARGVDVRGVHPSAFPAMLKMVRSDMTQQHSAQVIVVADSAPDESMSAAAAGLARIQH